MTLQSDINDAARDRAVDKIRKLLAVARDGRGNEHEATVAASQAEKLMRHYQLESADVVLEEIQREESFDRQTEDVSFEGLKDHRPRQVPKWVGFIAIGCGRAFTCKVDVVDGPRGYRVRFSGYALDVMLCRWVYRFLCEEMFRLSKLTTRGQGMSAAKSFRTGAASALQQRLFALDAERTRETEERREAGASGSALVLYDRKRERVDEMFGGQQTRQVKTSSGDRGAYRAGVEVGNKIAIPTNRPLSNTQTTAGYLQ
jgi:hypothetical protein